MIFYLVGPSLALNIFQGLQFMHKHHTAHRFVETGFILFLR